MFVMCTLVTGSPETPMEEKFSAATLADVLVDVPASLPFLDVVSYVLNQLHLMKEDTFCFKGNHSVNLILCTFNVCKYIHKLLPKL